MVDSWASHMWCEGVFRLVEMIVGGVNVGSEDSHLMCAGKEAAAVAAVEPGWTAARSAGECAGPGRTEGSGKRHERKDGHADAFFGATCASNRRGW